MSKGRTDFADGPSSASIQGGVDIDDVTPPTADEAAPQGDTPPTRESDAAPLSDSDVARRAVQRFKLAQQNSMHEGEDEADADDAAKNPDGATPDQTADETADETAEDGDGESTEEAAAPKGSDTKATPSTAPAGVDATLAARAKAVGLTDQHMQDFGADLEGIISRREARLQAQANTQATTQTNAQPNTPANAQPNDFAATLQALEQEGFDPKLVTALKTLHTTQATQVGKLTEQLREVNLQKLEMEMDAAFASSDDTIRSIIGEGPTGSLNPDSTNYQARAELILEMNRMQAGYEAVGERVPPIRELLPRAAYSLFHQRISKTATQKVVEKVRDTRTRHFTQPPAARQTPPPKTGDARALATINAKLAQYRDS